MLYCSVEYELLVPNDAFIEYLYDKGIHKAAL